MKKVQHTLLLFLAITISITTQAQLGGLIKKAKEKITEKKDKKETKQVENTEGATNNTEATSNKEETSKVIKSVSTNNDPNVPDNYFLIKNDLGNIILSNTPFGATATAGQNSFKSSDHIYGRLQLKSGTIKEALKIGELDKDQPFYFYRYEIYIYKNKKEVYRGDRVWTTILLRDEELNQNYLNFDILPDPKKATTIRSALDDFCCGKASVPLFDAINPEVFATDGVYKVDVAIRNDNIKDAWGKKITDASKWPTFEADFDFTFSSNDIATLKKNQEEANDVATAKFKTVNAMAEELPDTWSAKSGAPIPGYSVAKYNQLYLKYHPEAKIIRTFMSNDNGWNIIKDNDNFLPLYKYCNQWVTYFVKNDKGECYYHTCNLRQNYEGGGRYGASFLAVFDSEIKYLDCAKLK